MNFSGYFCLVAAAVLVVFAQQSEGGAIFDKITNYIEDGLAAIENKLDPGNKIYRDTIAFIKQLVQENINANTDVDSSIKLREGFSNGTQILSIARIKMLGEVLAAEKILAKNPEGARKLMQQSLADGISTIYTAGPPFFLGLGEAMGLSNGKANQGLLSASEYIQKGGVTFINTLKSGESLFNDGSKAGGKAAISLLTVYKLAIETGFAAMFYDAKKSANESLQALRDVQSSPVQLRIENQSCGVAAKDDPDCLDALQDINQVVKNALRNGAHPALVQELKEIIKCALDSVTQVDVDAKMELANVKKISEIDTFAATALSSKVSQGFQKIVYQLYAQFFLVFGDICARSGIQSDEEVQSAYVDLEKGSVRILRAIQFSEQILVNGLQNGGDASMLAFESVEQTINLAKVLFIESLVKFAKIVFPLL